MKIYAALIKDSLLNAMDHLSFTLLIVHRGLTATPIQNTANDLTSLASWIGIKGNLKDVKVRAGVTRRVAASLPHIPLYMIFIDFKLE